MSRNKITISKEILEDLYLNKNLSLNRIAPLFNTNGVTIYNRFKEYGIPTRKISEALKGKIPWNKGRKTAEETIEKLRITTKKLWENPVFRKKMEVRNKISSERMKGDGNPMKNKDTKEKVRKKLIGLWLGDRNPMKKLRVRRKISKILKGHIVSFDTRNKISQNLIGRYGGDKNPFFGKHHTKKVKENSRIRAIKQLVSGGFKNKKTSIEKILENKLIEKNINYKSQFPLLNITVVDFYIPKYRVVIYADGEFWHKSEWAKKQGVIEKDEKQNRYLIYNGYKVFRFSESEINSSSERCINQVLNYIQSH